MRLAVCEIQIAVPKTVHMPLVVQDASCLIVLRNDVDGSRQNVTLDDSRQRL